MPMPMPISLHVPPPPPLGFPTMKGSKEFNNVDGGMSYDAYCPLKNKDD